MSKILKQLNDRQQDAAGTVDGPVLIIAGAGSGKTRTLTHRVAHLIELGVNPYQILAVTFTNKASQEMRERILELLSTHNLQSKIHSLPVVGTFHSTCARILRREIEVLGYKKSFNIIDDQDQLAMMKKIMKEMEISTDQFNPFSFLNAISRAKNELLNADAFKEAVGGYFEEITAKVYENYQKKLKENNSLDFDDLIMLTVKLFQKYPEILERYQRTFRYILVDEYQDTNHAQYVLVNLLAQKHRNLCVVGDDWQCFPKGTTVQSPKGKIKIEKITNKDSVVAASGWSQLKVQKVMRRKINEHQGKLVEIKTQKGKKILVTPNHIFFSKLSLNSAIFYVYLMYKKSVGYRIGMAKGARIAKSNELSFGLNVRANQERADRMWILKVCRTKNEAIYNEQYFSSFYGIPMLVFLTGNRNMKLEQRNIDDLYKNIDTYSKVKNLFSDLKLQFEYPHHIPQSTIRNKISRININFVMFSDKRRETVNGWLHRISLNSTDLKTKKILEKNGFPTRKGKRNGWRIEIAKVNYEDIEKILYQLKKIIPDAVVSKKAALIGKNKFFFQPASHLRETMLVPVFHNGKIIEDEISEIKEISYQGKVYDLDIENAHNYIANGFVVHNSIYGWRQADIRNILSFEKDYPEAKVIQLERNYRSTQIILDAAYAVIEKNVNRTDKKLWTDKKEGHLITSFEAEDEKQEAEYVTDEVKKLTSGGQCGYEDIAVLYRTNAQSRILEEMFLRRSIPYRIIGGLKFYQRKEVKDMIAYLKLIRNPNDAVALERIINEPRRGIGPKTIGIWIKITKENQFNLIDTGIRSMNQESGITKSKVDNISKFCDFVKRMTEALDKIKLSDLIEKVFKESGYEKFLLDGTTEGEMRWENVQELLSVAKKYDSEFSGLEMFLEEVALVSDTDKIDQKKQAVHLMTLHSAKGLEFKSVFIVGLEEGILPHSRSMLSPDEMEEERRLMYVGITRAKEKVYLLFTRERTLFGNTQINPPSRFLDDIPSHLISHNIEHKTYNKFIGHNKSIDKNVSCSMLHVTSFSDGDHVSHPEFGDGLIVSVKDNVATVAFKKGGLKKLSLEFANLKKL
jgi:DNA helicase II / ATP-dependent DNA helicase PcrA